MRTCKKIIEIYTGLIFNSIDEAAEFANTSKNNIRNTIYGYYAFAGNCHGELLSWYNLDDWNKLNKAQKEKIKIDRQFIHKKSNNKKYIYSLRYKKEFKSINDFLNYINTVNPKLTNKYGKFSYSVIYNNYIKLKRKLDAYLSNQQYKELIILLEKTAYDDRTSFLKMEELIRYREILTSNGFTCNHKIFIGEYR